ncbi:MAG TPA: trypsin-like peptidase domain-containing protein, partial [Blastocatellia bacterium]
LSIGVAIGSLVHGSVGAGSDDNKLSISYSPMAPDALSAAFSRAATLVKPTVVNIKVSEDSQHGPLSRETTGSGIIVQPDGFILTNEHVVDGAALIKVKLYSGDELPARLIGEDTETDLAVLKVDPRQSLPFARLGDSEKLNVGDWVLAIGSPFGLDQSVTAGIISAKDRTTEQANNSLQRSTEQMSVFQRFLQTDAAINPGNSGGPLVNLAGEVVGINTMIATSTGIYTGIGFALPSSTAVEIYNQLVTGGRVRRGFIGIELMDVTPQIARQNNLEDTQAVIVKDVTGPDSPAARAGMRAMDIILSVDGQRIKNTQDLISRIASHPAGTQTTITYIRDGQLTTVPVTLDERKDAQAANPSKIRPGEGGADQHNQEEPGSAQSPQLGSGPKPNIKPGLGLTVITLTPQEAKARGIEGVRGAIVTFVDQHGVATSNDLRLDDVVVSINGKAVSSAEDFDQVARGLKSGDDVVIRSMRKGGYSSGRRVVSEIISFTMP